MIKRVTRNSVYYLLAIVLVLGACVPNKKITYLQEGDELKNRNEIVTETIYREHPMKIQEYQIQPLDILQIRFETITDQEFNFFRMVDPQGGGGGNQNVLNNGILVDAEGNVEFPVIGNVKVGGLTVFEAQDTLQVLANRYLKDVVVRMRLLNFRFTVLGIGGDRVINSANTRVTMMEAIGMAGGLGEMADRSIVKVIRQEGDVSKVFYVNVLEEDFIESEYYYVHQNDIIVVPPLKQRTFRTYWSSNLAIVVSSITSILLLVSLINR